LYTFDGASLGPLEYWCQKERKHKGKQKTSRLSSGGQTNFSEWASFILSSICGCRPTVICSWRSISSSSKSGSLR